MLVEDLAVLWLPSDGMLPADSRTENIGVVGMQPCT